MAENITTMLFTLGVVDFIVIGVMLLISASIGIFFRFSGGRQKTTKEFLMAGKDMGIVPVAFSLMATYMSAISVLGIPGEVYMYGSQFLMFILGVPVGGLLAAVICLPVFFDMDSCSAYQYLERRFGKLLRTVVSACFIVQTILYMSVVLYAPSLALNTVAGLQTWTSVVTLASVCVFYCSLGGMKAVLWTDVFQSTLMYTTIISIVVQVPLEVGGVENVFEIANNGQRLIFFDFSPEWTKRYTFWNTFAHGILFALSTFVGNQAQVQRMLSVRSLKRAQWALFLSIPLIMIFIVFCCLDGIVIYSLFHDCDPILANSTHSITSPDQLVPYVILSLFEKYPGLSGLCVSGIFAASLSTISSAVNSLTAVTVEDFIKPFFTCKQLSENWTAFVAKCLAVVYGLLCLMVVAVVSNFRSVLEAAKILTSMTSGPCFAVFLLGMLTVSANKEGTLLGLLMGIAVTAWIGFGSFIMKEKIPTLPRSIEGCYESANSTFPYYETNFTDTSYQVHKSQSEVPVIYRLSFMWLSFIGVISTFLMGYISSCIMNRIYGKQTVQSNFVSPVVRKYLFNNQDAKETSEPIKDTEMFYKSRL